MNNPPDLKYTESHEWVKAEPDGSFTIGITDHAQEALGDIVFLELPEAGRSYKQGETCGVIESVKAASDIYMPIAGKVTEINLSLPDAPQQVNADAYAAWMFRIRPDNPADLDALLDAAGYAGVAGSEN
jgi:glycine cleavage system H protein